MRIYLAGKIKPHDWREELVGYRVSSSYYDFQDNGRFVEAPMIKSGKKDDRHFVTGPFFLDYEHGSYHGKDSHGVGANRVHWDAPTNTEVVSLCLDAIVRSNVVFAWLGFGDGPDEGAGTAYGTIFELGYAKALGIPVWIAGDEAIKSQWFTHTAADRCLWGAPDPVSALMWFLDHSESIPQSCDITMRPTATDSESAKSRRLAVEFGPPGKRVNIPSHIRAAVWNKTGGNCWYCKKPTTPYDDFQVDHVIPVSKGGVNRIDNLVPCCKSCNSTKRASTGFEVWA